MRILILGSNGMVGSEISSRIDKIYEVRSFNHSELDVLYSSGEQVTVALVSLALEKIGVKAKSFLADQIPLRTAEEFGKARIIEIGKESLEQAITSGIVPVVAGFQGSTIDGRITTLGRGGSDTSAVALAAAWMLTSVRFALMWMGYIRLILGL